MNGYKTLIAAIVSGPLSAWAVTHLGLTLTADMKAYLVGLIMMVIMGAMRFVTNGPVPWLVNRINEERTKQVTEIVKAVLSEMNVEKIQTKGDPNVKT